MKKYIIFFILSLLTTSGFAHVYSFADREYGETVDTIANKNIFFVESRKDVQNKNSQSRTFFLYSHKPSVQSDTATTYTLISCKLINYKTTKHTRKTIVINNKDSIAWKNNKLYIKYILEYIANKEDISSIDMIVIKVPVDLCLSISCGLEGNSLTLKKYKDRHPFPKLTQETIEQNEFIKGKILSSYLLNDINSILSNYQLTVNDIEIEEPTLLFSREDFIKLYPMFSDCRLPKYVLGLYCCFVLKKRT